MPEKRYFLTLCVYVVQQAADKLWNCRFCEIGLSDKRSDTISLSNINGLGTEAPNVPINGTWKEFSAEPYTDEKFFSPKGAEEQRLEQVVAGDNYK